MGHAGCERWLSYMKVIHNIRLNISCLRTNRYLEKEACGSFSQIFVIALLHVLGHSKLKFDF